MTARELFLLWRERGCEWAEDRHDLPMAVSTHGAEGVIEKSAAGSWSAVAAGVGAPRSCRARVIAGRLCRLATRSRPRATEDLALAHRLILCCSTEQLGSRFISRVKPLGR